MADMMRITLTAPEKLVIDRAPVPVPSADEVLIKVKRIGVCGSDPTIYYGRHPYVTYPVIMGHEFSGIIESCGASVHGLKEGMRVAVIPHLVCGKCEPCQNKMFNFCEQLRCTGAEADGAHREYICMPAEMVMEIPDEMTLDAAAMIEPACVAYHGAKRGNITPNDTVLVIGAGPVGNFCMQSCKALGARKVFVADMDAERLELAVSLGADGIIDVSGETLNEGLTRLAGDPKKIDVFCDCVGEKGTVLNNIISIARRGSRVVVIGVLQNGYDIPLLPDFVQHELTLSGTTMYIPQDYRDMLDLMEKGTISTKGVITHYFRLDEIAKVFDIIKNRREKYFKIMLKAND